MISLPIFLLNSPCHSLISIEITNTIIVATVDLEEKIKNADIVILEIVERNLPTLAHKHLEVEQ